VQETKTDKREDTANSPSESSEATGTKDSINVNQNPEGESQ